MKTVSIFSLAEKNIAWLDNDIKNEVIYSKISLSRNLQNLERIEKLNKEKQIEILDKFIINFSEIKELNSYFIFNLNDFKKIQKGVLLERKLISNYMFEKKSDATGLLISPDESNSIIVNEKQDLKIQCFYPSLNFKYLYKKISYLDKKINEKLKFENKIFLNFSCLLYLPGLVFTERIYKILKTLRKNGFITKVPIGLLNKPINDFFEISTNFISLKNLDEHSVETIEKYINTVVKYERVARATFFDSTNFYRSEDKVFRSYGILSHCKTISYEETLQHISNLKLGIFCGIKLSLKNYFLNQLFFLTGPYHIQQIQKEELSQIQIDILRARFLQKNFFDREYIYE